jgi:hypothetical protein
VVPPASGFLITTKPEAWARHVASLNVGPVGFERTQREDARDARQGAAYGVRSKPKAELRPVKRVAAAPITKEAKDAAIRAYAAGAIDRHEMLRRITPQRVE